MTEKILHRHTGDVLWRGEADTLREAVERAVRGGVNLSDADLTGAHLSRADLTDADLSGANLTGANLTGVHLYRADLYGADLTRANLSRANLSRAYLTGANLTGADLFRANLSRADLSCANLVRANLYYANLQDTGLLIFQGERHRAVYYPCGTLQIGCEHHSLTHWQEHFREIGENNGYREKDIALYGAFIQLLSQGGSD